MSETPQSDAPVDDKKAAVAAAIARAKAKKAAQANEATEPAESEVPQSEAPVDDKKAAVAAAIAQKELVACGSIVFDVDFFGGAAGAGRIRSRPGGNL